MDELKRIELALVALGQIAHVTAQTLSQVVPVLTKVMAEIQESVNAMQAKMEQLETIHVETIHDGSDGNNYCMHHL